MGVVLEFRLGVPVDFAAEPKRDVPPEPGGVRLFFADEAEERWER